MAEFVKNDGRIDQLPSAVSDFIRMLSPEQKMLIILKAQIYGGRWEPMQQDLKNRLEGRPYIFKLANRINDDIERIEKMKQFEQDFSIDLCQYVDSIE